MNSIEWLEKEIYSRGPIGEDTPTWLKELFEQANEMHYKELSKTWDNAIDTYIKRGDNYIRAWEDFTEYYLETYKKD